MTTEEKKPRRRLTPDEKIARAQSQIDMVKKHAHAKQVERVKEAVALLQPMNEMSGPREALGHLNRWLAENTNA